MRPQLSSTTVYESSTLQVPICATIHLALRLVDALESHILQHSQLHTRHCHHFAIGSAQAPGARSGLVHPKLGIVCVNKLQTANTRAQVEQRAGQKLIQTWLGMWRAQITEIILVSGAPQCAQGSLQTDRQFDSNQQFMFNSNLEQGRRTAISDDDGIRDDERRVHQTEPLLHYFLQTLTERPLILKRHTHSMPACLVPHPLYYRLVFKFTQCV